MGKRENGDFNHGPGKPKASSTEEYQGGSKPSERAAGTQCQFSSAQAAPPSGSLHPPGASGFLFIKQKPGVLEQWFSSLEKLTGHFHKQHLRYIL